MGMTVQDLIDYLLKIEDKTKPILIKDINIPFPIELNCDDLKDNKSNLSIYV